MGDEGEGEVGVEFEVGFLCEDCPKESLDNILIIGGESIILAYLSWIVGELGVEFEEGGLGIIPKGLLNKAVEFIHC